MPPTGNPCARKCDIVIQHIDNETLVYDLTKNKAYCLNETSALVWGECDGTLSADEISQKISKKLKTPVSEDIVWLALSQFKKDGLLEDKDEIVTPFDGMNRREVVKRVGFASMVALPVISSLIAPSAAHAQSQATCGCGAAPGTMQFDAGCPCGGNLDCCINSCAQGTCEAEGTLQGPVCCQPAIICPPFNQVNPPGCGCNTNANCVSMNCVTNICRL